MAHKGETLSQVQPPSREVERGPHLFLEIECERAMAGPARWRLAGLEQVTVGRGARRTTHAVSSRVLALEIPDGWMSSEHVVLRRSEGRWTLRDLGSKNGTLVDGRRVDQVELYHGAVIQLGHTFLRFCEDLPLDGPPVRDFDGAEGSVGPLTTLSSDFGAVVVHGHTPTERPEVRHNRISIDTGAVVGGALTCAVLETDRVGFIQR